MIFINYKKKIIFFLITIFMTYKKHIFPNIRIS